MTKSNFFNLFLIMALVGSAALLWWGRDQSGEFVMTGPEGLRSAVALPYRGKGPPGDYVFRGTFFLGRFASEYLHIVPDDCLLDLKVNGKSVPLLPVRGDLCDWRRGSVLNLMAFMHAGPNHVHAVIHNRGGALGLDIRSERSILSGISLHILLMGCLALSLICLVYLTARRISLDPYLSGVLSFSVFLSLAYLSYTGVLDRSYDAGGHLDYVRYLAENLSYPETRSCWECYQPPLYYAAAAFIWRVVESLQVWTPERCLQGLALVFSAVGAFYVVFFYKLLFSARRSVLAASALVLISPGWILHSVRVGNDPLLYLGLVAWLYYIMAWHLEPNRTRAILCGAAGAMALAAKASALVVIPVTFMVWLHQMVWQRGGMTHAARLLLRQGLAILLLFGVGLGAMLHKPLWERSRGIHVPLPIGNAENLDHKLRVENRLRNYGFDILTYLKEPYTDAWRDGFGRECYWNYYLKSLLFGEFKDIHRALIWIAHILGWLLLVFACLCVGGALWSLFSKADFHKNFPLLCVCAVFVSANMLLRWLYPYSCMNDARYLFPIILAAVFFIVDCARRLQVRFPRLHVEAGLMVLVVVNALLSAIYYVLPLICCGQGMR